MPGKFKDCWCGAIALHNILLDHHACLGNRPTHSFNNPFLALP
jgi:hypothetical protein